SRPDGKYNLRLTQGRMEMVDGRLYTDSFRSTIGPDSSGGFIPGHESVLQLWSIPLSTNIGFQGGRLRRTQFAFPTQQTILIPRIGQSTLTSSSSGQPFIMKGPTSATSTAHTAKSATV